MVILSNVGWPHRLVKSICVSGSRYKTEACVLPLWPGPTPEDPSWIPVSFAISGLYEAGVEIANSQRSFYQCDVGLFLINPRTWSEHRVGYLELRPKASLQGSQSEANANMTLIEASSSNCSVAATSGQILDKHDLEFRISLNWNSHSIKSQDIFTSFLNALTIASEHDNEELRAYIPNAPAASGDVSLVTWETSANGPGADKLTWERLKRAVQLIWEDIVIG